MLVEWASDEKLYWFDLRLVHSKLKLQPTVFQLASDSKIGVNGAMLHQYNPTAFYQSEASLKPNLILILVWMSH